MKRCFLKTSSGMTIVELLVSLWILSMTTLVVGGGVFMIGNVYQKVSETSEAQQLLVAAAELLNEELSSAEDVLEQDGHLYFFSGKRETWIRLENDSEYGICMVSQDGSIVPLLAEELSSEFLYTYFEAYDFENACFIVKELAVCSRNCDKAAVLPELVIRAVNLEEVLDKISKMQ